MSIAYSRRKKAIRRDTWDFSAQSKRQAEIERFVKPPSIVERGYARLKLPSFGGKYVP